MTEASPATAVEPQEPRMKAGIGVFFALLGVIAVLNLAIGLVEVPYAYLKATNYLVSILLIAIPILALYAGASFRWTWTKALGFVFAGAATQVAGALLASRLANHFASGFVFTISQTGLVAWCLGLGALLACVLKDKNLLLPLAIFLALFDMWLVFVPEGPVGKIARQHQEVLVPFAYHIPKAAPVSHGGKAAPLAFVGPADFVFLAMFFVALYRFNMNPGRTFKAILPVLILYLLVVLAAPDVTFGPISLRAMPALLPIGTVVLLMNWREFKLTKDEKLSTLLIAVLGIAVVSWRMALHWHDSDSQPAPSQLAPSQAGPAPQGLPQRARQGRQAPVRLRV